MYDARVSDKALLAKIAHLLRSDAAEKQIAAAIVIGELKARDAAVTSGLLAMLDGEAPALQRPALKALAAIGAAKALPRALALLGSRDEGVRAAAVDAVACFGDEALPAVRERLTTSSPLEKRALEEILGRVGGRDAVSTLLAGLAPDDLESARTAVLPLRQRIKADVKERRRTVDQVKQFLGSRHAATSPAARVAALKLLSFAEDPGTAALLLKLAVAPKEPEAVRQEALIALRLAVGAKLGKLADKVLGVAEKAPLAVARVALYSFAGAALPPHFGRRLAKLAAHPETDRAQLAIELLGQLPGDAAGATLAQILLDTTERTRAEAAAAALEKRPEAAEALVGALLAARDRDRAQLVAGLLRPRLRTLDPKLGRKVVDAAVARLEGGQPTAEALLQAARAADAPLVAERLRTLADKLRKGRKVERALEVLRILGRMPEAAPDDGYALASLELAAGRREEALVIVNQLLDRHFDVASAMRKDRGLTHEHRYWIGFQFAERGHALGEELLSAVAAAAGRTKLGQMARAKLKSAGFAV